MDELDVLTVAFLEAHPRDAAREVERLAVADAAALLQSLPARITAPVLALLRPRTAADAITALDTERGVLVLGALKATVVAAVLRHVEVGARAALLERLPVALALACRALLRYPDDAVGAFAQTQILLMDGDMSAEQALEAMRQQPAGCDGVFVVAEGHALQGWVPAGRLVQASPSVPLSVLTQPIARLPAMMPLAAALLDPCFAHAPLAAVVERGSRVVGTVTLEALRLAQKPQIEDVAVAGASAFEMLAAAYWHMVSLLAQAAVAGLLAKPGARVRR